MGCAGRDGKEIAKSVLPVTPVAVNLPTLLTANHEGAPAIESASWKAETVAFEADIYIYAD